MFTETQKQLIETSYVKLSQNADEAGELLYKNIFKIAPELRAMFQENIMIQGRKLIQMLGIAVASLHLFDQAKPSITELGSRHIGYGVKLSDYAIVGDALLETLKQILGDEFTPDVEEAWFLLYGEIAKTMKQV